MVQQCCDRTQLSINPQKRDLRGLKEPPLSGHTLLMTTKVKCLGFILDKGLMWKAQLKNEMNKAYRTFGPVRAHMVKPGAR